jgi:hypothetical protein
VLRPKTPLTNRTTLGGANWLPVRVHVPRQDANQIRSLLSVAKLLNESKSQPWTTTAQSGLCSKTKPTSGSILSRSFVSRPIFPTGKLTTTDASNAGHLSVPNNNFPNTKPEPAERRVLYCGGKTHCTTYCAGLTECN